MPHYIASNTESYFTAVFTMFNFFSPIIRPTDFIYIYLKKK